MSIRDVLAEWEEALALALTPASPQEEIEHEDLAEAGIPFRSAVRAGSDCVKNCHYGLISDTN